MLQLARMASCKNDFLCTLTVITFPLLATCKGEPIFNNRNYLFRLSLCTATSLLLFVVS